MGVLMVQLIGLILGFIGTILTIVVTALTQWRVSYMVEGNAVNCDKRIDGQWLSRWDGLWLTCISKNQNTMHCEHYESLVIITDDFKAARVLMVFAIVVSIIALVIAIIALLFARCCRRAGDSRYCLLLTSGVAFLLAFILVAISIVWTTANIVREILNPVCKTMQRLEIGEAIFLGWPTMFFLLVAGIILCLFRPCEEEQEETCKTTAYSSQTSLQRPVYVPCRTQDNCSNQYSRSQYI